MKGFLPAIAASILLSTTVFAADQTTMWNVKAITPQGKTLDIKAFTAGSKIYAIKAVQLDPQHLVLDIKAVTPEGVKLPVKGFRNSSGVHDIKAIQNGHLLDIKALTSDGKKLAVKAVGNKNNQFFAVKALTPDGHMYAIKAISPKGVVYAVKGISFSQEDIDLHLNEAAQKPSKIINIKALPQGTDSQ
jgi:hypothetical protein